MYTLNDLTFKLTRKLEQLKIDYTDNKKIKEIIKNHFTTIKLPEEWLEQLYSTISYNLKMSQGIRAEIASLTEENKNKKEQINQLEEILEETQLAAQQGMDKLLLIETISKLRKLDFILHEEQYILEDYLYFTVSTIEDKFNELYQAIKSDIGYLDVDINNNIVKINELKFNFFYRRSFFHFSVKNYKKALYLVNKALELNDRRYDVLNHKQKIEDFLDNARTKTKKRRRKTKK